jgi:hypothetical protein
MKDEQVAAKRAPGEVWREADGLHIEVRGLPPPEPLVRIIRQIENAAGAGSLIVHHDRDPVLLYGELAERGWTATRIGGDDIDASEVRLKLARAA